MRRGRGKVYIGTSGYSYQHWGDSVFYPSNLPERKWLEHYAMQLDSVELNVTFYRLPDIAVFKGWRKRTPPGFRFAIKGSRYITHIKRLKGCAGPLGLFQRNAGGLGNKLSLILWQLHPRMEVNTRRLKSFCRLLEKTAARKRVRHAFEFRHQSWFCEDVYDVLGEHNMALCVAHSPRWPLAEVVTANFVYLRFHGGESLYGSNYNDDELRQWAAKIKRWRAEHRDVYAYFNNDAHGFAVKNAMRLRELTR